MAIEKSVFGRLADGSQVELYTLVNRNGMKVSIITYGGTITKIEVADSNGDFADVVLGFDTLDEYVKDSPYFGCIVGRYANRICKGRFALEGVEYTLAVNDGENHLHGGKKGFDKVIWQVKPFETGGTASLELTYLSKDGEEGFPGNLTCKVTYILTNNNEIKISYLAETDKTTIVNLTNHSYFNLAGFNSSSILNHSLMINADNYTPVDDALITTGRIEPVENTALDFTKPEKIGSRIEQLGGYDHNFVLNKTDASLGLAAKVYEPTSKRVMEVFTTEPGIQFYSGNFLDGSIKGKSAVYNKHTGFCLEAQHYPDSPNRSNFPSTILSPTGKYTQLTVYKFSTA